MAGGAKNGSDERLLRSVNSISSSPIVRYISLFTLNLGLWYYFTHAAIAFSRRTSQRRKEKEQQNQEAREIQQVKEAINQQHYDGMSQEF